MMNYSECAYVLTVLQGSFYEEEKWLVFLMLMSDYKSLIVVQMLHFFSNTVADNLTRQDVRNILNPNQNQQNGIANHLFL